jgi:Mn2+/Fe2+ NRAMP family transporter
MPKSLKSVRTRLMLFFAIMGPGLITAVADNDAGGIATYSSTGAAYGYEMLWMIFLITFSLGIVKRCALAWAPSPARVSVT